MPSILSGRARHIVQLGGIDPKMHARRAKSAPLDARTQQDQLHAIIVIRSQDQEPHQEGPGHPIQGLPPRPCLLVFRQIIGRFRQQFLGSSRSAENSSIWRASNPSFFDIEQLKRFQLLPDAQEGPRPSDPHRPSPPSTRCVLHLQLFFLEAKTNAVIPSDIVAPIHVIANPAIELDRIGIHAGPFIGIKFPRHFEEWSCSCASLACWAKTSASCTCFMFFFKADPLDRDHGEDPISREATSS